MQKYKLSLKPEQIFILKLLDTAGKFDMTKNQHVKNQRHPSSAALRILETGTFRVVYIFTRYAEKRLVELQVGLEVRVELHSTDIEYQVR